MLTSPLVLVFASSFGFSTSFYLPLSVVPIFAASVGAGGTGAGLATGVLMLSTVAAELLTPLLLSRFGYRAVFAAGLVLLGAPAFALGFAPTLVSILALCLARGFGLGIVLVVGGALVAELVPPERHGEGLGLYGVAVGAPFVVALPLGVWLAKTFGHPPVFVAGGLAAVLAGMALFGAGWGVTQNATLAVILERVAPSGYGAASALWYVAYDAGLGLGAFGFGVVAAGTGYPMAFALTSALVLAALAPASRGKGDARAR